MKITSEKAFDLLPYLVDIYDKLNIDQYRKELQRKYKGKQVDQLEVGIEVVKYIIKNAPKIKEEFFQIVAIVDDKDIEEVKKQSFLVTIGTVQKLFTDPELMSFFKQAAGPEDTEKR